MTQAPPPSVVPVCYRHPKRETYVRCTRCNRPICPDCMTEASVGHQCPECVAEGRRTQRPARTAFGASDAGRHGYVTKTLIGLNAIMLVVSAVTMGGLRGLIGGAWGGLLGQPTPVTNWGSVYGTTEYVFKGTQDFAGYGPAGVADGEYYRLFTAMFLHYGILHLLLNMWALWMLGRALEGVLGPVRYLAIYMLSGLGAGVAVYLFSPLGPPGTAGASGAIYGLFAAYFLVLRKLGRDASAVIPVIVINIIFTLSVPGISIAGHFGGLVTGAAVTAAMVYAPREHRNALQAASVVATMLLLFGLTVAQTIALNT
jgi:membrane associated rhomboid family serine protease